jgi:hypothetical protein
VSARWQVRVKGDLLEGKEHEGEGADMGTSCG